MDWDEQLFALFDDLEGQAESLYDLERESELADRSRAAYAAVSLTSRLMASIDLDVVVEVVAVGQVAGRLQRVGADWCLVHGAAQDWVVRSAVIVSVEGASDRSVPEVAWSPVTRLAVGSALRRLADAGERCRVHTVDGAVRDVVLTRVGRDFVECRLGEGRTLLLAHERIAAVQRRPQA